MHKKNVWYWAQGEWHCAGTYKYLRRARERARELKKYRNKKRVKISSPYRKYKVI